MASLLTKLLQARNITDVDSFLNPDMDRDWGNPYDMESMEEVANTVEAAIRAEKSILIYGDYDLDGMSATTVMLRGLNEIKRYMGYEFELDYFIPDRFSEGYGISEESLKRIPDCEFMITVDCGISCHDEIEQLKSRGIDVVVTDHHERGDTLPEVVFCDPEDTKLAGVGVALKLIQSLGTRFGIPHMWRDLVDIATLGTIADVMPLIDENRALVAEGLTKSRTCIKAILDVCNKEVKTATDLSFTVIPRLNSAGRLGKTDIAVKLLNSDDYAEAYNLALQLENINTQRKDITEDIFTKAKFQAENIISNEPETKFIVVAGENWHEGVIGIVAAKLCSEFNLPAIVCSVDGDKAHGSGRSVGEVDLHKLILGASDLLIKFGGHKGACGLTIEANKINEFREYLNKNVEIVESSLDFDMVVDLSELTINDVLELDAIEPCGNGNEAALFVAKNILLKNAKAVGADKNHLSCQITDGAYRYQAIMFNCPNIEQILMTTSTLNAVFTPRVEEYKGYQSVKLHLLGFMQEIPIETQFEEVHVEEDEFIDLSDSKDLMTDLKDAMIGKDGKLHDSQIEALELLKEGKSPLAVMPTGRGKSLIFQLYASMIALSDNKMSLFVYPLRALISDQAYHLEQMFGKFGLKSIVLNGETPQEDREQIYEMMKEHAVDIILTTPEFLAIHQDKFSNIGFVVIDECHHLGDVKIGQRTAYASMPEVLANLGNPQVLALSATVDDEILVSIKEYLPVTKVITDDYERVNLFVDDKRNIRDRDDFIVNLVATGEKTVIYVNSREQTVQLARMIKSRCPQIAMKVGFYNAGMTKLDRKKIETMFRDNKLSVLIATSAFGEGVNIPDIRHACLYHLPFNAVEFNQMSGRCGRDGKDAIIHLLYNSADAAINEKILNAGNPNRNSCAKAYKWIQSQGSPEYFENPVFDIFSELDLIEVKDNKIHLKSVTKKVNLEDSPRYCEGQNEISAFEKYKHLAMDTSAQDLQNLMRHPIKPSI